MKTKTLFLLATLMAMAQGAWAQTTVSTDQDLRAAIQNDGANITVTADIDLSNSTLSIPEGTILNNFRDRFFYNFERSDPKKRMIK